MNEAIRAISGIAAAAFGLAIVATILSKNAVTSTIIDSASNGLARVISAATQPVTGSGGINTNFGSALSSVLPGFNS